MESNAPKHDKAIKPIYNFKHYIIIAIIGLATVLISFFVPKYFDKSQDQKISILIGNGQNQLNLNDVNKEIINVKYSLVNDTSEVKGFYSNLISITNISDVGIQNVICKLSIDNQFIKLIPSPRIISNENKIDYSVDKTPSSGYNIVIPLLNKNEGISFICESYSKVPFDKSYLIASIRQNDLEVVYRNENVLEKENPWYSWFKSILVNLFLGLFIAYSAFMIGKLTALVNARGNNKEDRNS